MAHILVVDDDYVLRRFYQQLLELNGHTVVPAANGMEALKICSQAGKPFDLAIIDWIMPAMNGAVVKKHFEEEYPHMPIIVASGSVDPSDVPQKDNEMFLLKPFSAEKLLHVVSSVLRV